RVSLARLPHVRPQPASEMRHVRHQLASEIQRLAHELAHARAVGANVSAELANVRDSLAWRMLTGYRVAKARLAPPGSSRRAAYDLLLRSLKGQPRESPDTARAPAPEAPATTGPTTHAWGESVLIVSGSFGAMERYRCHHLREQLGLLGIRCQVLQIDDPLLPAVLGDYDVMILHRVAYSEFIDTMVEIARGRPAFILFDIDDLVFDPSKAALIDGLRDLDAEERRRYLEAMLGYRRTLLLSDGAIVTTDYLA